MASKSESKVSIAILKKGLVVKYHNAPTAARIEESIKMLILFCLGVIVFSGGESSFSVVVVVLFIFSGCGASPVVV